MSKTNQRGETAFVEGKKLGSQNVGIAPNDAIQMKMIHNPYSKDGINKHFRSAWNRGFNLGSIPEEK